MVKLPLYLKWQAPLVLMSAEFQHNICYFHGASGTGKTFAFKLLSAYFQHQGIPQVYLNYTVKGCSLDTLLQLCDGKEVVLLDNADLYLTKEMLYQLKDRVPLILVSQHTIFARSNKAIEGNYALKYDGTQLEIKPKRG